uniref:Uncharacterized protein n=1 Tax=Timema bartmani TaxID=61472 RepID=A0A7R9F4N9_9NEOP|nr:unnamed protein product [Timema bartmani]
MLPLELNPFVCDHEAFGQESFWNKREDKSRFGKNNIGRETVWLQDKNVFLKPDQNAHSLAELLGHHHEYNASNGMGDGDDVPVEVWSFRDLVKAEATLDSFMEPYR